MINKECSAVSSINVAAYLICRGYSFRGIITDYVSRVYLYDFYLDEKHHDILKEVELFKNHGMVEAALFSNTLSDLKHKLREEIKLGK